MPRDVQIAGGIGAAPQSYTVPNATEIVPRVVNATFDGSGAAGSFLPTLEIVSDGGVVVARCPTATAVAAGASAEVSFFPNGEQAASGSTPAGSTANQTMTFSEAVSSLSLRQCGCAASSGSALFSTGTTQPTCIVAGVYSIVATVFVSGTATNGIVYGTTLDAINSGVTTVSVQDSRGPRGTGGISDLATLALTWYFGVGDSFEWFVYNGDGVSSHTFSGSIYIQTA